MKIMSIKGGNVYTLFALLGYSKGICPKLCPTQLKRKNTGGSNQSWTKKYPLRIWLGFVRLVKEPLSTGWLVTVG